MAKYISKVKNAKKFGADDEPQVKPLNSNIFKMALFERDKPSNMLLFHYNPTSWSDSRSTKYEEEEVSEWQGIRPQYDGTGSRSVSMTLFFDDISLGANMPAAAENAGYRTPNAVTHGVRYNPALATTGRDVHGTAAHRYAWAENRQNPRSKASAIGGSSKSTRGMRPTQGSINWLHMRSMTVKGFWEQPPILIFNGLKHHSTPKLFTCVITKVDVTPLIQKPYNPWDIRRANVDIELKEYLDSTI